MLQLSDFILLARKILVGIMVILIPFLIIWGSLRLFPKVLPGPAPRAESPVQPR